MINKTLGDRMRTISMLPLVGEQYAYLSPDAQFSRMRMRSIRLDIINADFFRGDLNVWFAMEGLCDTWRPLLDFKQHIFSIFGQRVVTALSRSTPEKIDLRELNYYGAIEHVTRRPNSITWETVGPDRLELTHERDHLVVSGLWKHEGHSWPLFELPVNVNFTGALVNMLSDVEQLLQYIRYNAVRGRER